MFLILGIVVTWTILAFHQSQRFLQFLQIEEYTNSRFLYWFIHHSLPLYRRILLVSGGLIAVSLITMLAGLSSSLSSSLLAVLWIVGGIYLIIKNWHRQNSVKVPLIYTARAIRILSFGFIFQILLPVFYLSLIFFAPSTRQSLSQVSILPAIVLVGTLSTVSTLCSPFFLVIANIILIPVETAIRWKYLRMAYSRFQTRKATVIGITGSYGKTSTKDVISHLLSTKYEVAYTPKSYNTLMGICKIINRGDIRSEHQYFVAEMGAYKPGEIKGLCRLLQPKIGVITAIGPQHLERFGSLENIAIAKYELIAALPGDGLAVFNADDDRCYTLATETYHVPVVLYGFQSHLDELYIKADNICMTPDCLEFTLIQPQTGGEVNCRTRLLGKHNISNILAASAVASYLGLSLSDIAEAIAQIEPVPHRLELKRGANGITILDDAYNSNPVGARNALETLALFRQGQRILITPGLVELGELEIIENRRMGNFAASACDLAILVGYQRTNAIRQGLKEAGFSLDKIVQVPTLQEAIAKLPAMAQPGDTVLLLNDLPDTYEFAVNS